MATTTTPESVALPDRRILTVLVTCLALLASLVIGARPAQAQTLTSTQLASRVLASVNSLRKAHHLPVLLERTALDATARTHSAVMARYNALSYRLGGESPVSTRIYRAGFNTQYAVENVGVNRTQAGVLSQARAMAAARVPASRMFSKNISYIGVGVYKDVKHNKYWVTIDFARARPPLTTLIANSVLSQLNAERRAHGLPALSMNAKLIASAHKHNHAMAAFNTMSHQLPNELDFASRILQAGYNYLTAGENVGWNSQMTKSGALFLETLMYKEVPPNDGHRKNILSRSYRSVGIDIYFDTVHHKLWLTEDFGCLM